MGKIMRDGVEFSGNTSVIYRNGIPYISQGVPDYKIIPKTITLNGTYDPAQDNADGYSNIVVDVPTQDPPVLTTKTITANGTYNASADSADGYSKVTVNVNQATETKSITSNGTYKPSSGKIGFSSVTVNVNQATEQKSITSNGTYTPSSGKIGFSKVTVSVPQSSRVSLWSGVSYGNVSVNLRGYSWVYIVVTDGSNLLLQVNGSVGVIGRSAARGQWQIFYGARSYKATTSGITAESNARCGIEDLGNDWIYITNVYGIKNLS